MGRQLCWGGPRVFVCGGRHDFTLTASVFRRRESGALAGFGVRFTANGARAEPIRRASVTARHPDGRHGPLGRTRRPLTDQDILDQAQAAYIRGERQHAIDLATGIAEKAARWLARHGASSAGLVAQASAPTAWRREHSATSWLKTIKRRSSSPASRTAFLHQPRVRRALSVRLTVLVRRIRAGNCGRQGLGSWRACAGQGTVAVVGVKVGRDADRGVVGAWRRRGRSFSSPRLPSVRRQRRLHGDVRGAVAADAVDLDQAAVVRGALDCKGGCWGTRRRRRPNPRPAAWAATAGWLAPMGGSAARRPPVAFSVGSRARPHALPDRRRRTSGRAAEAAGNRPGRRRARTRLAATFAAGAGSGSHLAGPMTTSWRSMRFHM